MRSKSVLVIVVTVLILGPLSACSSGLPFLMASTITPTITLTSTPTITPTSTRATTPMPLCTPTSALDDVEKAIQYDEFAAQYIHVQDYGMSLGIWFVNPLLSGATGSLDTRISLARQASESLIQELLADVECLSQVFDSVDVIEVDSSYTGWLSLTFASLQSTSITEQTNYVIDQEPIPLGEVPSGKCSWPDARANAEAISVPDSNRAVYLVRDRTGVNLYVFWSRPEDLPIDESTYYLLIGMDMPLRFGCLYPPVDVLWLLMKDQDGNLLKAEQLPGEVLRGQQ